MVTKGIIVALPEDENNIFKVRVPLFENGDEESVIDAILSTNPGTYNGYQIDDVVIITFENEKMNIGIILGKLFINIDDSNSVYNLVNELKVTDKAILPADTRIGKYCAQDFFNLYNGLSSTSSSSGGLNYKLFRVWGDDNE